MVRIGMFCAAFIVAVLASVGIAQGRIWTDSTGKYTLDAGLIAFDERHVILERTDHQLVTLPLEKLSDQDREFLRSKEASDAMNAATGAMQTWTLADGMQVVERIVDYARKDVTLQRRRGRIYVNDRQFENLPEMYQRMIPKIVAHFDRLNQPDANGLTA